MNSNDSFDSYDSTHPAFNAPWDDPWLLQDADGDGLTNQQELWLGTDPYRVDTDGDGLTDGQELVFGTNPRFPDTGWGNRPQLDQADRDLLAQGAYDRFSQNIDANIPPFAQATQVAQAALAEDWSPLAVHDLLSESSKFQEIAATLGLEQAEQFASLAIAAAERQNAIDSLPHHIDRTDVQETLLEHKQSQL